MRISCSGCRVLRKGCSEDCTIRPCLQWIKSSEYQSNATLFLAKFYGRAGLLNLINAGPEHLRPAIFKSLLYEACGRIVNPIYGSTGLLQSGSWHLCQVAVEAVLKGEPIAPLSSDSAVGTMSPSLTSPLKACNIRHVAKCDNDSARIQRDRVRKVKSKKQFKRSGSNSGSNQVKKCYDSVRDNSERYELNNECGTSQGSECDSVETEEASMVKPGVRAEDDGCRVDLELRL